MPDSHVIRTWQGPSLRADELCQQVPGLTRTYFNGVTGPLLGARRDPGAGFQHSYRVEGVQINPEKLLEYQRMFHLPASAVLPLGYVHILGFPLAAALMARRDFPLPLAGMLHTANEVESFREITSADLLTIRAFASHFQPHRRGTEVNMVVEVGQDDAVWWRGTSTYLVRGIRMDDDTQSPVTKDVKPAPPKAEHPQFQAPHPTARWELPGNLGRKYAKISGDVNPIHLSPVTARAFGFRRTIMHGMYTASRALSASMPLPPEPLIWSTKFYRPVLLPGQVDLAVTRGSAGAVSYTAWQTGSSELHLKGEVKPL